MKYGTPVAVLHDCSVLFGHISKVVTTSGKDGDSKHFEVETIDIDGDTQTTVVTDEANLCELGGGRDYGLVGWFQKLKPVAEAIARADRLFPQPVWAAPDVAPLASGTPVTPPGDNDNF